ncbi:MAG: pyridoxamine 5'-phosphate oxidase [Acidimicrobiales bacterium]
MPERPEDLVPTSDPLAQVRAWLDDATVAGIIEPNAMTLATAAPDGRPSARMVLLKAVDAGGLVFYTSRSSEKGRELAANPWAALVLHWRELGRQVRVTGPVAPTGDEDAAAYFATRPRGSQLATWASRQSEVLPSRAELEEEVEAMAARFNGGPVPLPPWWAGYRVGAETVELWQGRPDRLHDRIRYRRAGTGGAPGAGAWVVDRLWP